MLELILLVCLASDPTSCRDERPPIDLLMPMACMLQGQQIAAEWLEDHPKLVLKSYRCAKPERGV